MYVNKKSALAKRSNAVKLYQSVSYSKKFLGKEVGEVRREKIDNHHREPVPVLNYTVERRLSCLLVPS
jgi:hypothetical protein